MKRRKKKYTEKDKRDDLERLELLLISLEVPVDYKKVYEIKINDLGINVIEENMNNLIWLNHNLTILNKGNIKLIETLKLIQRILRQVT